MAEDHAKNVLIDELKKVGGSHAINSLSVRVKWGQDNLKLGTLRKFIENHPEAFKIIGNEVHLPSAIPMATTGKAVPGKAPPAGVPFTSKGPPMKRPFEDEGREGLGAVAKARFDSYGEGDNDSGYKGGKDNGKSEKGFQKGGPKGGKGFGKNSYGDDSMGLTGVPKAASDDNPPGLKGDKKGGGGFAKSKGGKSAPDEDEPSEAMSTTTFVPKGGVKREMAPKQHGALEASTAKSKQPAPQSKQAAPHPKVGGAPKGGQPAWLEDSLVDMELSKAVTKCKVLGIDLELELLAKRIGPSSEFSRHAQRCVSLLKAASGKTEMKPVVEPCGSLNQQTELDGSDIDVAFRVRPGLSPDDRNALVKDLRERLQAMHSLVEVHGTMAVYPHTVSPLAIELKGATPRTIAHVLIVEQSGDPNEQWPLTVDTVIKQLCDTCELSRDLVRLVKLWAFQMGMTSHQKGYMNGVAWAVLTLCFLQQKQLVPSLDFVQSGGSVRPPSHPPILPVVLREFFQFLANLGAPDAVRGYSLTRAQKYPAPAGFLFLEDPAQQDQNLAGSIGESQWTRIVQEAQRVGDKIGSRGHRWLHWAEVFDPRDVAPGNTPKLPPLGQMADEARARMTPELAKSLAPSKGGGAPPAHTAPPKGSGKGPGPYQTGPPPGGAQAGFAAKGKGKGKW